MKTKKNLPEENKDLFNFSSIEKKLEDDLTTSSIVHKEYIDLLSKKTLENAEISKLYLEALSSLLEESHKFLSQARTNAKESRDLVDEALNVYRKNKRQMMFNIQDEEDLLNDDTIKETTEIMLKSFLEQEADIAQSIGEVKALIQFDTTSIPNNPENIVVTIICVTFNHEKYIGQALDSFLNQKTNFKFKIFVGEDCGGDNTAGIIKDYAKRHPDIIVPFLRKTNMGPQRNAIDMCNQATSPFIAFCDGDDYWIDEYKLQKQVDYMNEYPSYRFCFGRTEIVSTENWIHKDYYKRNSEGRCILPEAYPGVILKKAPLVANDFIIHGIGHISSLLIRWNYQIEFPNWFFDGVMGDTPLKLIQLGGGEAGYIPDVVSAYRINETGVYTGFTNNDEMFLKTRPEYIRTFTGILEWYKSQGIQNYPKILIENRLISEYTNFIESSLRLDAYDEVINTLHQYPDSGKLLFGYLASANNDRRQLERTFGWNGYKAIVRNKFFRNLLRPYAKLADKLIRRKKSKKTLKIKGKLKNVYSWIAYNLYSLVPKNNNIWVISGFRKNTYMDNTRYFYEYVLENYPEIKIYWATLDKNIYNRLKQEEKPVLMMRTFECVKVLSRAKVAIVDHYAITDFESISGFNDRTKVVQLWHGVGFKSATNKDGTTTTGEPGVQPSDDILVQPGDNSFCKLRKKIKYLRHAYYRELYEKYLLFLTPGNEMINRMAIPWKIPEDSWFTSGYPRLKPMLETSSLPSKVKILYAPTYRWNPEEESKVVNIFLEYCNLIQKTLDEIDGTLTLRLHPHTWRNYKTTIVSTIRNYPGIQFDTEKDVYDSLANYSITISDYSSIIVDFAILSRPTIYFCPDYDVYKSNDTGLVEDFEEQITGVMTNTWEDTLNYVKKYVSEPEQVVEYTKERCEYFYNPKTTTCDSSGLIVEEIKRRIVK